MGNSTNGADGPRPVWKIFLSQRAGRLLQFSCTIGLKNSITGAHVRHQATGAVVAGGREADRRRWHPLGSTSDGNGARRNNAKAKSKEDGGAPATVAGWRAVAVIDGDAMAQRWGNDGGNEVATTGPARVWQRCAKHITNTDTNGNAATMHLACT